MKHIKCVVVGDSASGKTSMLEAYINGSMPDVFVPTVYKAYTVQLSVDSETIELALTDTGGVEGYDRIRPVAYPQTDVFILCIDPTMPTGRVQENLRGKWHAEIRHHCPNAPIILVGTKLDLRTEYQLSAEGCEKQCTFLTADQGLELAKEIKAVKYLECSALTKEGLKEVFEETVRLVLNSSNSRKTKKKESKHHGDSNKVSSFFHSLSSSRRNSETSSKPEEPPNVSVDAVAATPTEKASVKSPTSIKAFFRGLRPRKSYSYEVAMHNKALDKQDENRVEQNELADTSCAEENASDEERVLGRPEAEVPEPSDDEPPTSSTGSDEISDADYVAVDPEFDLKVRSRNSHSSGGCPGPAVSFRNTESKRKVNTLKLNAVLVGDEAVGKSSLLTAFTEDECSQEYTPTEIDNCFVVEGTLADSEFCLRIWDVSCSESFNDFRPLRYQHADVIIICFSLVSSASFESARTKWYQEVRKHCPGKPAILVGTKLDLREDPETIDRFEDTIGELHGRHLAQEIGAEAYVECSALRRKAVGDAFREAVLATRKSKTTNHENDSREGAHLTIEF